MNSPELSLTMERKNAGQEPQRFLWSTTRIATTLSPS